MRLCLRKLIKGELDKKPVIEVHIAVRFALAFVLMMVLAIIPMHLLMEYAYPVYFACLQSAGRRRYHEGHTGMEPSAGSHLGGLNIQPSEFMKLAVILVLARYFHRLSPEDIRRFIYLIPPLLLIAVPAILILRQPNLGTTLILVAVGGVLCFLAVRCACAILSAVLAAAVFRADAGSMAFHA